MNTTYVMVSIIGLFSTLVAWLAGRNSRLTQSYDELVAKWRLFAADLSMEIDRLHAKILDLEDTIQDMRARINAA